uniref:Uncharacterized protein n=1 Tax=Anguilla anguilla TaxID=7936 RepID=A0A0E9VF01_ANGAN
MSRGEQHRDGCPGNLNRLVMPGHHSTIGNLKNALPELFMMFF